MLQAPHRIYASVSSYRISPLLTSPYLTSPDQTNERQLLKLKGDTLAEALRTLPTRIGTSASIDALLERAFEFPVASKLVVPREEPSVATRL